MGLVKPYPIRVSVWLQKEMRCQLETTTCYVAIELPCPDLAPAWERKGFSLLLLNCEVANVRFAGTRDQLSHWCIDIARVTKGVHIRAPLGASYHSRYTGALDVSVTGAELA